MNDLLNQLQAVIETAETNRIDAERWHNLVTMLGDLGYGPRIEPAQIAELVPNLRGLQELASSTQEVGPASAGPKMPRRKLTLADEHNIMALESKGWSPEQIADDLGLAKSAVRQYIADHA